MTLDCSRLDCTVMISVSLYWFSFVRVTSLVLCTHFLRGRKCGVMCDYVMCCARMLAGVLMHVFWNNLCIVCIL